MKKDILQKEADQLAIAVSPPNGATPSSELWDTFLINLSDEPITSVLVSSRGYGEVDGEKVSTTILRHFFEEIGPKQVVSIEPIKSALFQINNEFWVSFVYQDHMYDKKYIFIEGSIQESELTAIPFSEREGVVIV